MGVLPVLLIRSNGGTKLQFCILDLFFGRYLFVRHPRGKFTPLQFRFQRYSPIYCGQMDSRALYVPFSSYVKSFVW
jgi:hypothetical protein